LSRSKTTKQDKTKRKSKYTKFHGGAPVIEFETAVMKNTLHDWQTDKRKRFKAAELKSEFHITHHLSSGIEQAASHL
jgi:hypothetical protein